MTMSTNGAPAPITFAAVKAVLDKIVADWTTGSGFAPDLSGVHGQGFGWATKDELLAAKARGNLLIQKEIIGVKGQGQAANLVFDLTVGLTVAGHHFPRMPLGGLDSTSGQFLDPAGPEIKTIIDWIEAGCPD